MLRDVDPKLYRTMKAAWAESRARCERPNHPQYCYYGGRGIKYCDRWKNFDLFLADMGPRPPQMTLERLDVNGGYCPENCVWASRKDQSRNQRDSLKLTYRGKTRPLMEWAEITGIKYETLKMRVRAGYSPEEVIEKAVKCGAKLSGKQYKPRKPQDPSTFRRGAETGAAKLTEEAVLAIRYFAQKGLGTAEEIAEMFQVTGSNVSAIIKRRTWRHL